jgi:hypothetical protein
MQPTCREPGIGALLHAYELDALTEEDRSAFERHLLSCEACFQQVMDFQDPAAILKADPGVRAVIQEAAASEERRMNLPGRLARLKKYLWPEPWPFVLRPAVICALLFLAVLPLYYSLKTSPGGTAGSGEPIFLAAFRTAGGQAFHLDAVDTSVIEFVYSEAAPGKAYRILLETAGGRVLHEKAGYSGFDEFGVGRLGLPEGKLGPGTYRLRIINPGADPPFDEIAFIFDVLND